MLDIDQLHAEHARYVLGIVRRRMHPCDHADAEDLAQQVWLRVFERASTYEDRGLSPKHWLGRIAVNIVTDYYRHRAGNTGTHLDRPIDAVRSVAEAIPDPEPATIEAEQRHDLLALLGGLTPKQRRVIEGRFLRGESVRQAAASAGVTVEGCKKLQQRALDKLRQRMAA